SRFALPMVFRLRLRLPSGRRFGPDGLLVAAVTVEGTRRRELTELVADHVLRHVDGNVLLSVVDPEGQADELRQDRRAPAPDAYDLVAAGCAHRLRLLQEIAVDKRTFPDRACHVACSLLARMARPNDKTVRRLVLARLGALGTLAPGGRPVLATLGAPAVGMVDRVHGDRAHGRARTPPARATRLAGRLVHMVGVRHGADRCHAVGPHAARLAGVEAQNGPARVAADQLTVGACRARNLAAPAGLKLDVVHDGADRHGS